MYLTTFLLNIQGREGQKRYTYINVVHDFTLQYHDQLHAFCGLHPEVPHADLTRKNANKIQGNPRDHEKPT